MNAIKKPEKIILELEPEEYSEELLLVIESFLRSQKSTASQADITQLAEEIQQQWWDENKGVLLGEDRS